MPPNLYKLRYRKKSDTCELRYCEVKSSSVENQFSIGVFAAYVHKLILRIKRFGYDCNARIIGGIAFVLFGSPTGVAERTKISQFGLSKAADSIAQACLRDFTEDHSAFIYIDQILLN